MLTEQAGDAASVALDLIGQAIDALDIVDVNRLGVNPSGNTKPLEGTAILRSLLLALPANPMAPAAKPSLSTSRRLVIADLPAAQD